MFQDREWQQMYRYCVALTADPSEAYDLLHTGVEKFLSTSQKQEHPMAYVKRILRNAWLDQKKKKRESLLPEGNPDLIAMDVDDLESLVIDRMQLESMLKGLSGDEREWLYLWAVEGMTVAEMATWCGVSRGTMLSRMHRLKKKLKERGLKSMTQRNQREVGS